MTSSLKRHNGFTLTEVLLALGIFTVGFSMMAMSLPIAALMQKNTADAIFSKIVAGQSQAIIKSNQTKLGDWTKGTQEMAGIDERVPLECTAAGNRPHTFLIPFPADDNRDALFEYIPNEGGIDNATFGLLTKPEIRTYPTGDLSPRIYWVPLLRRTIINHDNSGDWQDSGFTWHTKQSEWQVVVAILRYRSQATYDRSNGLWAYDTNDPKIPGLIRVNCSTGNNADELFFDNDFNNDGVEDVKSGVVIDENANIYRVVRGFTDRVEVAGIVTGNPQHVWFSPGSALQPGDTVGGSSPMLDAVVISSNSSNRLFIAQELTP